mmetsp:Transcript_34695/g.80998  ORF Transcript_34695/g.80998 Transcript_34695/m.80998 type:complete len:604 (+) Transcript_34695:96-1907(+)
MSGGRGPSSDWSTLYVGDLHPDVTEAQLHERFSTLGPVAAIHVCRDSITQRSLGYAYVNYFSQADALQAIEKLNYTDIKGRCCRIMWSNKERTQSRNLAANVFVGNLDPEVDSKALHDTFSIFGHIISCKVSTSMDGSSRGYGFVQYESEDAAKQAIERVNGMAIGGRKVFVGPFQRRNAKKEAEEGDDRSLYVRNIPPDWDDGQVSQTFSEFGAVESCLIMSQGKGSRRYGFVNFADAASAQKAAAELHGKDVRTEEEKAAAEAEAAQKDDDSKKEKEEKADEGGEGDSKPAGDEAPKEGEEDGEDDDGDEKGKVPPHCLWVRPSKGRSQQERRPKEKKEPPPESMEGVRLIVRSLPPETDDDQLRSLFSPFGTVTDVKAVQDRESGVCRGYGFVRLSNMEEASAAVKELHLKEIAPGKPPLSVGLAAKGERKGKGDGKGGYGSWGGGKGGKGFKGPPAYDMLRPGDMYGQPGMGLGGMYPTYGNPMVMGGWRPMQYMPVQGKGGMPSMMPPVMSPAMQAAYQRGPLTPEALAMYPPAVRKQMLGEQLFPKVQVMERQMAHKITGMLLEMPDAELVGLLSNEAKLSQKVSDAKTVLARQSPS